MSHLIMQQMLDGQLCNNNNRLDVSLFDLDYFEA